MAYPSAGPNLLPVPQVSTGLSSRPLVRTWLYFPSFTSFSLGSCTTIDSVSVITHSTSSVSSPALLLRSVHFLQHHTTCTFAPYLLTAVRVKTIFHHSLMLVWRSLICQRNVVCRPPMEESKGSALILKSKNIVMMKIAVNVSRYLL